MSKEEEFVQRWFRDYYARSPPPVPSHFEQREFGFMFFGKDVVRRHIGYKRPEDLHHYLVRQTPAHVYYSSARYLHPQALKMEQKGWQGADLVFDLDADHVPGAENMSYAEMLAVVRRDMVRLLDDFLLGDLGFAEEEVRIVFSGGRGYHAHVSNQKVLQLGSHERSEIVDYVCGTDLDLEWLFRSTPSMLKDFKSHRKVERSYAVPALSSGGWRRHARTALEQLLQEFEGMDPIEARRKYPGLVKAKDNTILGLQHDLYGPRGRGKRGAELVLEMDSLEYIADRNKETFLEWVRSEVVPRGATHVDEPVTRDVKRLIRMPYSLHGKTGMQVVSLTRDQLNDFDPLRDAFPALFPGHSMKVEVKGPVDLRLRGERVHGQGVLEVPTYAAIFLILRLKATLA